MNNQTIIDKYGIVEGFIPLKDKVVYAIELSKLNRCFRNKKRTSFYTKKLWLFN